MEQRLTNCQNMIQSDSNFKCNYSSIDSEDWFGLGRLRLEFAPAKETLCWLRIIIDKLLHSFCVLSEI